MREILLVLEIGVRCQEDVKRLGLRGAQQIAVAETGPTAFVSSNNLVPYEGTPQWDGRSLIKQDTHSSRCECAAGSMLQYGTHLRQGHAREPLHELVHGATVFEIFEERRHRHS